MDDELTDGYREPCSQCAAVDWGVSDEGRFYCKSCHNVIERTREEENPGLPCSGRVTTLTKKAKTKESERARHWSICEGFQFILTNQANALLKLGVSPQFKDVVLCQLWRLYLQKTRQAYTRHPLQVSQPERDPDSELDSAPESFDFSTFETDGSSKSSGTVRSDSESASEQSQCCSSLDAASHPVNRLQQIRGWMSMRKTLALLHVALVWSREALTLSDLLWLVKEGHVPYVNAHAELPAEMKLERKDAAVFRVKNIPSYDVVHRDAGSLILLLKLPDFPPVSRQCLLHPAVLSLRYLIDLNLPDELHLWVCRLMSDAGLEDRTFTCRPFRGCSFLPRYEAATAALIIVTLKLIFGLDDLSEWGLSNEAGNHDDTGGLFNLRRWYRLMQAALIRAQQRRDRAAARDQWTTSRMICTRKNRCYMVKKRRVAKQVQSCFEKLSSCPVSGERAPPSSFRFCWGDEDGADGPSLHQKRLDGVMTLKRGVPTPRSSTYWHPALKLCRYTRCRSHYPQMEPTLPRSFVWLLQLFRFLLDVKPAHIYEQVLHVERALFMTDRAKRKWPHRGRPCTGRPRTRRPPTKSQKGPKSRAAEDPTEV